MTWTIARVKEELPDVQMAMPDGEVIDVMITGRRERYPQISPLATWNRPSEWPNSARYTGGCTVSWPTLVHCLNTNQPVRY